MPEPHFHLSFEKITDAIPGMVAVYNIHTGNYLYVNRAITKLLGLAPKDFIEGGIPFATSLVHPDDLPLIMEQNAKALERANKQDIDNEIVQFEYRMRHKDGTWRWLHTDGSVFSRDKEKKVECVLNVSIDITERKRIEEELQQYVEHKPSMLESIVHSSDDAIISKTLDGIIRTWNKGAQKIFGYKSEEAIGKHITLIIPPDRLEEENVIISKLRQGQSIDHYETKRLTKDGRLIDISITISPIKNSKGEVIAASKIARDITEHKQQEEALREEKRRKDEFLAVLAHELRNPLAPISSAAQILNVKGSDTEEGKWSLNVIQRQLEHMTRLIDDLLDVSRITSNKLELRKEKIELQEVLKSAVETSQPLIQEAGHKFFTSFPIGPMYVEGDFIRLAQVFSNLLTNAAKYTPHQGTIWLTAEEKNRHAVITVKDTGIGIPRDMIPRIFELFVQGTHSPHAARGLGIGLTLVKQLITMHHGSVEVLSDGPNKGSTFIVYLPLVKRVQTKSSQISASNANNTSLRILIADDNNDALATMEMMLRLQGNETKVAHDGREAVKVAEMFLPDIVLLDIGMPYMNGYEAAKAIRSKPWGRAMKLIAVTGWGQAADKRQSHEAGFDHHLTKPVDAGVLSDLLIKKNQAASKA